MVQRVNSDRAYWKTKTINPANNQEKPVNISDELSNEPQGESITNI